MRIFGAATIVAALSCVIAREAKSARGERDLFTAVRHNDFVGVENLMRQGTNPKASEPIKGLPVDIRHRYLPVIFAAVGRGYLADVGSGVTRSKAGPEILASLLIAGAAADPHCEGGSTPLMVAAMCSDIRAIDLLVQHGASVNSRDDDGHTPLMWSVSLDDTPGAAEFLLSRNVSVDAVDDKGNTALIYAARLHNEKCVEKLLKYGASRARRNRKGQTAFDLVRQLGSPRLLAMLAPKGSVPRSFTSQVLGNAQH